MAGNFYEAGLELLTGEDFIHLFDHPERMVLKWLHHSSKLNATHYKDQIQEAWNDEELSLSIIIIKNVCRRNHLAPIFEELRKRYPND